MAKAYYEDISVGDRFEFGSETVTQEDIIEFAEEFDPQYFHLDEEAATDSVLGGLCASGWQTVCLTNRMFVTQVFDNFHNEGGRGVDDLRWREPVRPGDRLSGWVEIADKSPHDRDPSRGDVDVSVMVVNQDEEVVLSFVTLIMVLREPE